MVLLGFCFRSVCPLCPHVLASHTALSIHFPSARCFLNSPPKDAPSFLGGCVVVELPGFPDENKHSSLTNLGSGTCWVLEQYRQTVPYRKFNDLRLFVAGLLTLRRRAVD